MAGDAKIWGAVDRARLRKVERELAQANAVIDAINTLTENGETTLEIETHRSGRSHVTAHDRERDESPYGNGDTLREALEACVAARDQHDKEART